MASPVTQTGGRLNPLVVGGSVAALAAGVAAGVFLRPRSMVMWHTPSKECFATTQHLMDNIRTLARSHAWEDITAWWGGLPPPTDSPAGLPPTGRAAVLLDWQQRGEAIGHRTGFRRANSGRSPDADEAARAYTRDSPVPDETPSAEYVLSQEFAQDLEAWADPVGDDPVRVVDSGAELQLVRRCERVDFILALCAEYARAVARRAAQRLQAPLSTRPDTQGKWDALAKVSRESATCAIRRTIDADRRARSRLWAALRASPVARECVVRVAPDGLSSPALLDSEALRRTLACGVARKDVALRQAATRDVSVANTVALARAAEALAHACMSDNVDEALLEEALPAARALARALTSSGSDTMPLRRALAEAVDAAHPPQPIGNAWSWLLAGHPDMTQPGTDLAAERSRSGQALAAVRVVGAYAAEYAPAARLGVASVRMNAIIDQEFWAEYFGDMWRRRVWGTDREDDSDDQSLFSLTLEFWDRVRESSESAHQWLGEAVRTTVLGCFSKYPWLLRAFGIELQELGVATPGGTSLWEDAPGRPRLQAGAPVLGGACVVVLPHHRRVLVVAGSAAGQPARAKWTHIRDIAGNPAQGVLRAVRGGGVSASANPLDLLTYSGEHRLVMRADKGQNLVTVEPSSAANEGSNSRPRNFNLVETPEVGAHAGVITSTTGAALARPSLKQMQNILLIQSLLQAQSAVWQRVNPSIARLAELTRLQSSVPNAATVVGIPQSPSAEEAKDVACAIVPLHITPPLLQSSENGGQSFQLATADGRWLTAVGDAGMLLQNRRDTASVWAWEGWRTSRRPGAVVTPLVSRFGLAVTSKARAEAKQDDWIPVVVGEAIEVPPAYVAQLAFFPAARDPAVYLAPSGEVDLPEACVATPFHIWDHITRQCLVAEANASDRGVRLGWRGCSDSELLGLPAKVEVGAAGTVATKLYVHWMPPDGRGWQGVAGAQSALSRMWRAPATSADVKTPESLGDALYLQKRAHISSWPAGQTQWLGVAAVPFFYMFEPDQFRRGRSAQQYTRATHDYEPAPEVELRKVRPRVPLDTSEPSDEPILTISYTDDGSEQKVWTRHQFLLVESQPLWNPDDWAGPFQLSNVNASFRATLANGFEARFLNTWPRRDLRFQVDGRSATPAIRGATLKDQDYVLLRRIPGTRDPALRAYAGELKAQVTVYYGNSSSQKVFYLDGLDLQHTLPRVVWLHSRVGTDFKVGKDLWDVDGQPPTEFEVASQTAGVQVQLRRREPFTPHRPRWGSVDRDIRRRLLEVKVPLVAGGYSQDEWATWETVKNLPPGRTGVTIDTSTETDWVYALFVTR